jgi:ferredoxin
VRVVVDYVLCDRQGLCVSECPSVFDFDDDDVMRVIQPEPPKPLREQLLRAVRACPKNAITVQEECR